jgi:hypothetical protein
MLVAPGEDTEYGLESSQYGNPSDIKKSTHRLVEIRGRWFQKPY